MFRCANRATAQTCAWACLFLTGCLAGAQNNGGSGASNIDPANATYTGVYDGPVTLTDGLYEGLPFEEVSAIRPRLQLIEGPRVDADLDGDGIMETAVLLTENSGGTGHFLYIAILKPADGAAQNVSTYLVDDRAQIRRFYTVNNELALDLVQAGPEDGACCPTQKATLTWAFKEGELTPSGEEVTGTVSLADISGIEWTLTGINARNSVPDSISITFRIEGDKAMGAGGCNSYSGSVTEGDQPGDFTVGPLISTKMLCPGEAMQWEQRYLTALQNVRQFNFSAGGLALGCLVDNDYVTLYFDRATESGYSRSN